MFVEKQPNHTIKYEPVTFNITCQSDNDLRMLWHIFNLSIKGLENHAKGSSVCVPIISNKEINALWSPINEEMILRGIIPKE